MLDEPLHGLGLDAAHRLVVGVIGLRDEILDEEWDIIASLAQGGGPTAVDDALRQLPTTTSEVMHPETYPSAPATVDVPELASKLGNGWHDLDVGFAGRRRLGQLA